MDEDILGMSLKAYINKKANAADLRGISEHFYAGINGLRTQGYSDADIGAGLRFLALNLSNIPTDPAG